MRLLGLIALLAFAAATPAFARQGTLIVGNKGENSVSFVDLDTGREVQRADSGPAPHEVAVSPNGKQAAVVAYGGETVHLYDVATKAETGRIELPKGARPHGIVWLRDGRIMATAEGIDAIVIATPGPAWSVKTIATGQKGSHMVAISPDLRFAYTANLGSGSVTKVDLVAGSAVRSSPAGKGTEGIAITADGREVWASARESDRVFVFDAETLEQRAEIPVGRFPLRLIMTPDGKSAVTSNLADGSLSVIDVKSRKLVRTIPVLGGKGEDQVTILFNRDGSRLYAALTRINKIAEIEFATGKRLGLLSAGGQGDGLAIAP